MSDRPNEIVRPPAIALCRKHRTADALPAVEKTTTQNALPSCRGAARNVLDLCRSFDRMLWQALADEHTKGERK